MLYCKCSGLVIGKWRCSLCLTSILSIFFVAICKCIYTIQLMPHNTTTPTLPTAQLSNQSNQKSWFFTLTTRGTHTKSVIVVIEGYWSRNTYNLYNWEKPMGRLCWCGQGRKMWDTAPEVCSCDVHLRCSPTQHLLFRRGMALSSQCQFGCSCAETAHHLFIKCPTFTEYRESSLCDIHHITSGLVLQSYCNTDGLVITKWN